MLSEKNWELFRKQLLKVLELEDEVQLANALKGKGNWDSLRTIQIYILLREYSNQIIEETEYLEVDVVHKFKRFFT